MNYLESRCFAGGGGAVAVSAAPAASAAVEAPKEEEKKVSSNYELQWKMHLSCGLSSHVTFCATFFIYAGFNLCPWHSFLVVFLFSA